MQYTKDTIWRKEICILQPEKGYRFAIDAVLLARFIKAEPEDRLLEIGAGSGVVSILASKLNRFRSVTAIEVQKELAELCRKNFAVNEIEGDVHEADLRDLDKMFSPDSFDLLYSNPPYRKAGSGRLNPSSQKAIARHEIKMKLQDLFECTKRLLEPAGRLTVILPVFRESDFHQLTSDYHFHRHEWKYVHSFSTEPPVFFLATVGKIAAQFIEHPPLVIYETPGQYTPKMQKLLTAELVENSD